MRDYEVYVDDDRYTVPSLYLVSAANDARARVVAETLMHGSDHHQGVELLRDGERIYALGSFALCGLRAHDAVEGPTA